MQAIGIDSRRTIQALQSQLHVLKEKIAQTSAGIHYYDNKISEQQKQQRVKLRAAHAALEEKHVLYGQLDRRGDVSAKAQVFDSMPAAIEHIQHLHHSSATSLAGLQHQRASLKHELHLLQASASSARTQLGSLQQQQQQQQHNLLFPPPPHPSHPSASGPASLTSKTSGDDSRIHVPRINGAGYTLSAQTSARMSAGEMAGLDAYEAARRERWVRKQTCEDLDARGCVHVFAGAAGEGLVPGDPKRWRGTNWREAGVGGCAEAEGKVMAMLGLRPAV